MTNKVIDAWGRYKEEAKMCLVPMTAELRSDPEDCTDVLLLGSLERKC